MYFIFWSMLMKYDHFPSVVGQADQKLMYALLHCNPLYEANIR